MAARFVSKFVNKNPRNLEMLGKQAKPTGYQFEVDADSRKFIYKVELIQTKSHQEALLTHYQNGVVLSASTREKAIRDQLYSPTDTCAALNLGRVLALRCLQSGIHFVKPVVSSDLLERSSHQREFFNALEKEGLILDEPEAEEHSYANDSRLTWDRYPQKNTRLDKLDD